MGCLLYRYETVAFRIWDGTAAAQNATLAYRIDRDSGAALARAVGEAGASREPRRGAAARYAAQRQGRSSLRRAHRSTASGRRRTPAAPARERAQGDAAGRPTCAAPSVRGRALRGADRALLAPWCAVGQRDRHRASAASWATPASCALARRAGMRRFQPAAPIWGTVERGRRRPEPLPAARRPLVPPRHRRLRARIARHDRALAALGRSPACARPGGRCTSRAAGARAAARWTTRSRCCARGHRRLALAIMTTVEPAATPTPRQTPQRRGGAPAATGCGPAGVHCLQPRS